MLKSMALQENSWVRLASKLKISLEYQKVTHSKHRLHFDIQFVKPLTGVTHRAHEPDLLQLESNLTVDLWITPVKASKSTHEFS